MTGDETPPPIRCRPIEPADLGAVTDLLRRGFPTRPRTYWDDGPRSGFGGRYFERVGQSFFRGPDRPRPGDLAYTERVIFGP